MAIIFFIVEIVECYLTTITLLYHSAFRGKASLPLAYEGRVIGLKLRIRPDAGRPVCAPQNLVFTGLKTRIISRSSSERYEWI